jgi:DNA-binding transcriptional ArsR family regulator
MRRSARARRSSLAARQRGVLGSLLNLPGIKQQDGDGVEKVDVPKTRRDLADYLGLTIETVSQTLTKLKQDGLIALAAATRIEIRDRGQLEELTADEIKTNENGNGRNPHTSAPGHQLLEGCDKSGKGGNAFTDGVLRLAGPARARRGSGF